jgi:hypothetical protein
MIYAVTHLAKSEILDGGYTQKRLPVSLEHLLVSFSLFKSGCLSANIKLIIHKTLLRSTMTYVCPPGKLQQTHLRQGQHFQNEFLHTIRIFRGTGSQFACDFYSSDGFITKLARNKQKSYKITRINTFATCRMTSLNTESLNLAAVKLTTVN